MQSVNAARSKTASPPTHLRLFAIVLFTVAALMSISPQVAYAQNNTGGVSADEISEALKDKNNQTQNTNNAVRQAIKDIGNGQIDTDNARAFLDALNQTSNRDTGALNEIFNGVNPRDLAPLGDRGNNTIDKIRQQGNNVAADFIAQQLVPTAIQQGADKFGDRLSNLIKSSPQAGGAQLTNPTQSDLLASVLFSRNAHTNDGTVGDDHLPLDELKKYGGDPQQEYGSLTPGNGVSSVGERTANTIEGLFKYHWIVGVDEKNHEDSNDPNVNPGVMNKAFMSFGVMGAHVFDGVKTILISAEKVMTSLDIAHILGFESDDNGNATGGVGAWLQEFFEKSGVRASMNAIMFLSFAVIATMFLIVLMKVITGRGRNAMRDGSVQSLGTRIIVMVMALPFLIAVGSVFNSANTFARDQLGSAAAISDNYVVDTLDWAAATNLSLGIDQGSSPESSAPQANVKDGSGGGVNVAKVNNTARSIMTAAGSYDDNNKDAEKQPSAADMLSKYNSGEIANVTDYFAKISHADKNHGANSLAASNTVLTNPQNVKKTKAFDKANQTARSTFFLSERSGNKESDESSSSSSDSNSDKSNSGNGGGSPTDKNVGKDGQDVGQKPVPFGAGGVKIACEAYVCDAVSWNDPSTYIYGASAYGRDTVQRKDARNFFGDALTSQANDPTQKDQKPDDDTKKVAMQENAITIALANRMGGVVNKGGYDTLSTQSTAMLLQSTLGDSTLHYSSYQTSRSSAGNNSGAPDRKAFVRYVIPNTGEADLSAKTMQLAIMWACGGVIAVVVLLALLRKAIIAAVINMVRGFLSAAVTGNIGGLVMYFIYRAALMLSFLFSIVAIVVSMRIADFISSAVGAGSILSGLSNIFKTDRDTSSRSWQVWDKPGDKVNEGLNAVGEVGNTIVGGLSGILVVLILTIILTFPVITMPKANGQANKESIASVMVGLPFLLADILAEKANRVFNRFGHKDVKRERSFDTQGVGFNNPAETATNRLRNTKRTLSAGRALAKGKPKSPAKPGTARPVKNGGGHVKSAFASKGAGLAAGAIGGPLVGAGVSTAASQVMDAFKRDEPHDNVIDGEVIDDDTIKADATRLDRAEATGNSAGPIDSIDQERDSSDVAVVDGESTAAGAVVPGQPGTTGATGATGVAAAGAAGAVAGGAAGQTNLDNASGLNVGKADNITIDNATMPRDGGEVTTTGAQAQMPESQVKRLGDQVGTAAAAAGGAAIGSKLGRDGEAKTDNLHVDADKVVLDSNNAENNGTNANDVKRSYVERDAANEVSSGSQQARPDTARDGKVDRIDVDELNAGDVNKDAAQQQRQENSQPTRTAPTFGAKEAAIFAGGAAAGLAKYRRDDGDRMAQAFERAANARSGGNFNTPARDNASKPSNSNTAYNGNRNNDSVNRHLADMNKKLDRLVDNDREERRYRDRERRDDQRARRDRDEINRNIRDIRNNRN